MSAALRRHRFSIRAIDPFDLAFALLIVALLVLVGATFREYAVSNDEGLQHHYGELIVAYYKSGFADKSVFDFGNLYLYGGLFDVIAVLLAHVLPFDPYDIRHVMCAVTGIGGVAATWATARMIAGPRAGLLAGLALGALRRLVRRHVQSHQGRAVCRRDDGRDVFSVARRARSSRSAAARYSMVRDTAGRRARPARHRPVDGWLRGGADRPAVVDHPATRLAPFRARQRSLVGAFHSRLRACLCDHDRILALGVAGSFSIRLARFLLSRTFTTRSAPSSPAKFIP